MDVLYASPRLEFSLWDQQDPQLAHTLWGNPQVTHFLTTDGIMTPEQIDERLKKETEQYQRCGHQYHPVFLREGGAFIGVCGLRPYGMGADIFELGVHLLPDYWHAGYAQEAARRTIDRAFSQLGCQAVFAGHHPKNTASRALLLRLGFVYDHDEFYSPTGLYHPSYFLWRSAYQGK